MEKQIVLNGYHPIDGDVQCLFTENERATAIAIAKDWLVKGWNPYCFSKTYKGDFVVLLNYRNFDKHARQKRMAA